MATLHEVLGAFSAATSLNAPHVAGALLTVCAGVGGVLVLAWVFQAGTDALRGGALHAPRLVLLSVAAFLVLLITLGVFYR